MKKIFYFLLLLLVVALEFVGYFKTASEWPKAFMFLCLALWCYFIGFAYRTIWAMENFSSLGVCLRMILAILSGAVFFHQILESSWYAWILACVLSGIVALLIVGLAGLSMFFHIFTEGELP